MTSPIDPLRVLKDRLAEVTAPIGLELEQFVTIVGNDGENDHVQALFAIDAANIGKTTEQANVDEQFADLARAYNEQTQEDKVDETRASLEALLNKHKKEQ